MDVYPLANLYLLSQLEEYLPYMLEEEILFVIFVGSLPSADSLPRWELARRRKEREIMRRIDSAMALQKTKTCKKLANQKSGRSSAKT